MGHLAIIKRREDGSVACLEYECTPVESLEGFRISSDEEKWDMLLHAEQYGNSTGKVRVHFDGMAE